MTSMRRRYVASTSLRRHVPAGNLAPPWPPNILNLPTPMSYIYSRQPCSSEPSLQFLIPSQGMKHELPSGHSCISSLQITDTENKHASNSLVRSHMGQRWVRRLVSGGLRRNPCVGAIRSVIGVSGRFSGKILE